MSWRRWALGRWGRSSGRVDERCGRFVAPPRSLLPRRVPNPGLRTRHGGLTRVCRHGRSVTRPLHRSRFGSPPPSATRGRSPPSGLRLSTADRSFGAGLTGSIERGELRGPVRLELRGAAGQSFGAFASGSIDLTLVGQANDYVGKGLSGGRLVVRPEPDLPVAAAGEAIAGNTVLYGATGGRLHLVGRAGMRFAVRNSGASAVVEGIGAARVRVHDGRRGRGARPGRRELRGGMTGGRAYLYDPSGRHVAALHADSVSAVRLSEVLHERPDGRERFDELFGLLQDHAAVGSDLGADWCFPSTRSRYLARGARATSFSHYGRTGDRGNHRGRDPGRSIATGTSRRSNQRRNASRNGSQPPFGTC